MLRAGRMAALGNTRCGTGPMGERLQRAVHVDQTGGTPKMHAAPPRVGFDPFLSNAATHTEVSLLPHTE